MNSMKIGTYQMDTTFGLYLPEYTIPAPAVQTNFVKIIGRDGSVDLSNALGLHYDSRTWSLDFKCFDPTVNWHTLSSQVMNAIHGKRLNFEFDDDPNYFWTGRVSVQNYVSNHGTGTLKVTIVSDPFKYAKLSTIVTKTASTGTEYTGSMVTFNDGLIYDLSADIEPIQDLHGYDHPWPGGGGKNKVIYPYYSGSSTTINGVTFTVDDNGVITANGLASANAEFILMQPGTTVNLSAGDWTISGLPNGGGSSSFVWNTYGHDPDNTTVFDRRTGDASYTFNCPNGLKDLYIGLRIISGYNCQNLKVYPQFESGSSPTSYAPYSNICPISGRTGVNVYRTGKNLFKTTATTQTVDGVTFTVNADGTIVVNGTAGQTVSFLVGSITFSSAVAHILSCCPQGGGSTTYDARIRDASYNVIGFDIGNGVSFTPETKTYYVSLTIRSGITVSNIVFKPMIRLATETDDTYEPYTGNTYAADWTTQAGTVYGGTLDVVTGVLTVDRAMVDLGTLTWAKHNTSTGHWRFVTQDIPIKWNENNNSVGNMLCSVYPAVSANDTYLGITGVSSHTTVTQLLVCDESYTDAAAFKTAMSGVQLCYELATPLTYQLTPQEVEALVGTNNVWSDGGNVTVAVVTPETLTNNGRAVVPTLTASADMVLKWGNYSASVQQGTSTIPQLILENGANLIYIIGTGSISFTWQEVRL